MPCGATQLSFFSPSPISPPMRSEAAGVVADEVLADIDQVAKGSGRVEREDVPHKGRDIFHKVCEKIHSLLNPTKRAVKGASGLRAAGRPQHHDR